MFRYLYKKMNFFKLKRENEERFDYRNDSSNGKGIKLSTDLKQNLVMLKDILGNSTDIIYREFYFGENSQVHGALIFLEGLSNKQLINDNIMKPLMYDLKLWNVSKSLSKNLDYIENTMVSAGNVKRISYINEIIDACLSGDTIFLMESCNEAIDIHSKAWEGRGIEEPKTEAVVRGPREGFTETMATNMALIRRKIKNPNLAFETMQIGKQTNTSVCLIYLKGVVNLKLVAEVKNRLRKINTDAILESGYIEQFIEDDSSSIFPTIGNSEKPDTAAAKILEGRVCILVDGTPFALTVPMLFVEGFQSAEDYYSRPFFASMLRVLRFICFEITVLAPATYVMLATFHQELIPTTLLFTMAAGREGVPFPAIMEAGLMVITFEILREAGVRLPRPVGQAVSIVGALVIGEAAVSAGLVGGLLVIVVALTAVSSFVVPVYTDVCAILRIVYLILAGTLGIFGVGVGMLAILVHIVSLRSFGSPYLSPLAPLTDEDIKDSFFRAPLWKMNTRPRVIGWHNITREEEGFEANSSSNKNSN